MADNFLSLFCQLKLKDTFCVFLCALSSHNILAAFECIIENGALRLLVQEFFFKHISNACI